MPYTIGVSTGWWRIAKAPELLGIAAKIGYGATSGVQFVQIDLDTTAEFMEPQLDYQIKRVKSELGMSVGVHAEVGEIMSLDSAEQRLWEQSHERLCVTLKHAAELGMIYVNLHLSAKPQLMFEESRYKMQGYFYPVVDYLGRPLYKICDEVDSAKRIVLQNISRRIVDNESDSVRAYERKIIDEMRQEGEKRIDRAIAEMKKSEEYKNAPSIQRKIWEQQQRAYMQDQIEKEIEQKRYYDMSYIYDLWKISPHAKYVLETGEIGAYQIVAQYMKEKSDPLWESICGGDPIESYNDPGKHGKFNAAVASMYIYGHLTRKDHPANDDHLDGKSVLEWCEDKKLMLLFEVPEAGEGTEGLYRLFNPLHSYHLIKRLNSDYIKLCIDFEHMLAHRLNPDDVINNLPNDAGKAIFLFHLTKPVPYYGTAHVPLQVGTMAQEQIYKWLWLLRKKGFENGYMIYERGGGQTPMEVMQQSVTVLRNIAECLDKNIAPDDLPESFYGIGEQTEHIFKRQMVAIRDNAMAPVSGLISIPEETHTFLGAAAVQKGKVEEWRRGRYR